MTQAQTKLLEKLGEQYSSITSGQMYGSTNQFTGETVRLNFKEARAYKYAMEGYKTYLSIEQPCKTKQQMKELKSAIHQFKTGKHLLLTMNSEAYNKLID